MEAREFSLKMYLFTKEPFWISHQNLVLWKFDCKNSNFSRTIFDRFSLQSQVKGFLFGLDSFHFGKIHWPLRKICRGFSLSYASLNFFESLITSGECESSLIQIYRPLTPYISNFSTLQFHSIWLKYSNYETITIFLSLLFSVSIILSSKNFNEGN